MTSDGLCFFDTNVLLYSFDNRYPHKQQQALTLVGTLGHKKQAVISTQVLIELFTHLTRKFKAERKTASLMVSSFCHWPVIDSDMQLVLRAMARSTEHQTSIFDAMIVEAALRSGATTLYSEDMQHGRRFGSLTITNPFI